MSLKQAFTSSIGRKLVMAFTGLFLISFLVIHCTVNGMVFFNDGGAMFEEWGHFLSHNWVVRVLEVGLFLGIIAHTVQGLMLWSANAKKRNTKYAVSAGNVTSKWYSRSMGLLGTIILLFLVVHLKDFWWGTKVALYAENDAPHSLFAEMKEEFSNLWVVIVYCLGCFSLAWHLLHGFSSAFQTLGIDNPTYKPVIKNVGFAFSILVPLIFALIPVSIYMGWIA